MFYIKILILLFSLNSFVLEKNQIIEKLKEIIPDFIEVTNIDVSLSAEFYSVELSDGSLFYISSDGKFIINGDLYKIDQKKLINFSEMRDAKTRRKKISQLNREEFIIFKPQFMKTEIFVFTDVDCGYCRKLHSEIDSYLQSGIQVNYLAYPREGLESETFKKMKTVWCSKDPQTSLSDLKLGKKIDNINCDNKIVSKHYNLAKEFDARGTPTIILENGALLAGYHSAEEILEFSDR